VPCAVETVNLTKRFPKPKGYLDLLTRPFRKEEITALEDINLRVGKGELFGLLGPNGAGKTTLIKVLCTLVLPTSGTALVSGHDVTREGKQIRRMIGYVVSDERSFYWRLTGRRNLRFFATLNNLSRAEAETRIAEAVELTGLEDAIDRTFKEYSSGMKQKLAIARGLLTRPEILFLDEPTRNLDPIAARDLRRFIRKGIIAGGGKTVVLATNNMQEADELCDRVAIIHQGRVRMCGPLEEIRRRLYADHTYVLKVKGPLSEVEPRVSRLSFAPGVVGLYPEPSNRNTVVLRIDSGGDGLNVSDIVEGLVKAGLKVAACYPDGPSLDDVFTRALG